MNTVKPFVQTDESVYSVAVAQPLPKPDMSAPRLVLKQGGTMVMVNPQGLMPRSPDHALGMFVDDTRGLQEFDLRINGHPLQFLGSSNLSSYSAKFSYATPLLGNVEAGTVEIDSDYVVDEDDLFFRVRLANTSINEASFDLELTFQAGFQDTFEVRGSDRKQRGVMGIPTVSGNRVQLSYVGLDKVQRAVHLQFGQTAPTILSGQRALYSLTLAPQQRLELEVRVSYRVGERVSSYPTEARSFVDAYAHAQADFDGWKASNASVQTSHAALNRVIDRAVDDINMLRLGKLGIAAGLPQFAVPFGRDSAITGLQTCWMMPSLSRQIILALAAYQGTKFDTVTAEEPGKIMHELRTGEMVRNGEAPFGPYYGTVDATQLWLMLIGEYTKWTGDFELSKQLWKQIEAAVSFLRRRSRSGFITYGGRPGEALANQCWKDSYNSIMYSDGKLAVAPIAVCEAQGYMYAAFVGVAKLARHFGKLVYAGKLDARARMLRSDFRKKFWMPEKQFVALALDKHHRQCDVISSNPGHLLGIGILSPRQEKLVAKRLMRSDMFNGWFIRTLASSEVAYEPSDYQRGSGWPHDNGLAAAGMSTIGHQDDAIKVFGAHVDIASAASDFRLHELYCGHERTPDAKEPVHYKVACVPQAWAAGSILHMLRACLNPQPRNGVLKVVHPNLPEWLQSVTVNKLRVYDSEVDLQFERKADGKTTCVVIQKTGAAKIRVVKRKVDERKAG